MAPFFFFQLVSITPNRLLGLGTNDNTRVVILP